MIRAIGVIVVATTIFYIAGLTTGCSDHANNATTSPPSIETKLVTYSFKATEERELTEQGRAAWEHAAEGLVREINKLEQQLGEMDEFSTEAFKLKDRQAELRRQAISLMDNFEHQTVDGTGGPRRADQENLDKLQADGWTVRDTKQTLTGEGKEQVVVVTVVLERQKAGQE